MVELTKGLHVVDGVNPGGDLMNVAAIVEDDGSVHLVDCGLPGDGEKILGYLHAHIRNPKLRTVILTHFDGDHVGSAAELKKRAGCELMAPEFDAKVISGKRFSTEELKRLLGYDSNEAEALKKKIDDQEFPPFTVDRILHGGEHIKIGRGARVLHVPGHTPGHVVIHLEALSALVTGDTVTAPEGRLGPPAPEYTPAPKRAVKSLKVLAKLDYEILVTYHWPPITSGASRAVAKYLKTLA